MSSPTEELIFYRNTRSRRTKVFLTESDTYPKSVSPPAYGIAVNNLDGSNQLTFILKYADNTQITGYVPAGEAYEGNYRGYKEIDVSGSTSFIVEVLE